MISLRFGTGSFGVSLPSFSPIRAELGDRPVGCPLPVGPSILLMGVLDGICQGME